MLMVGQQAMKHDQGQPPVMALDVSVSLNTSFELNQAKCEQVRWLDHMVSYPNSEGAMEYIFKGECRVWDGKRGSMPSVTNYDQ